MRIEVIVPEKLLNEFESTTKSEYASRSEAIRDAMRRLIVKLKEEE